MNISVPPWLKKQFGQQPFDTVQANYQNLAATGVDDFAAYDAAQLAESGIGEDQMTDILGQTGIEDADFLAADAANLADVNAQSMGDIGFDAAGMAAGLAKGLAAFNDNEIEAPKNPQGSILKPIQRAGVGQPIQQPQVQKQAIGQPSNAMQTIQQQNLGSIPNIQDVIKMRQMRGMY